MKNKIIKSIATALLLSLIFSQAIFATSRTGTVTTTLPSGGYMKQSITEVPRTGNYSYMTIQVNCVTPPIGSEITDNYEMAKFRLYSSVLANTPVSDTVTISETATTAKKIYFMEGTLSMRKFDICVAGNNPNLAGVVTYTYDGK